MVINTNKTVKLSNDLKLKQQQATKVFSILRDFYKEREVKFELQFENIYTLLIATMLSAQMTDEGVNKVSKPLFKVANTPEKMVKLGEEKLKQYIKSVNYFNTKAKHIIEMSQQLINEYNSKVPDNIDDLVKLAGVGRKTASCVLIYGFKKRAMAVDTHVFRVTNRLGLVNENTVEKTEQQLLKIVPDEYILEVNQNLVLLGRYICQARKPQCEKCPLQKLCKCFKDKH